METLPRGPAPKPDYISYRDHGPLFHDLKKGDLTLMISTLNFLQMSPQWIDVLVTEMAIKTDTSKDKLPPPPPIAHGGKVKYLETLGALGPEKACLSIPLDCATKIRWDSNSIEVWLALNTFDQFEAAYYNVNYDCGLASGIRIYEWLLIAVYYNVDIRFFNWIKWVYPHLLRNRFRSEIIRISIYSVINAAIYNNTRILEWLAKNLDDGTLFDPDFIDMYFGYAFHYQSPKVVEFLNSQKLYAIAKESGAKLWRCYIDPLFGSLSMLKNIAMIFPELRIADTVKREMIIRGDTAGLAWLDAHAQCH